MVVEVVLVVVGEVVEVVVEVGQKNEGSVNRTQKQDRFKPTR